jgi:regulatory protein
MAVQDEQFNKCLIAAIRILTGRDYSCAELIRKLSHQGFPSESIRRVINECQRQNYLDDARYARSYTHKLHNKGYGGRRIQQMLVAKGLDRKVIDDSLSDYFEERIQIQSCRQAMLKKIKNMRGNESIEKARAKIYRFLYQRGFSSAVILKTMDEDVASFLS